MKLAEAKKLSVCYGRHTVLKQTSFELNAGEVVGLIGPNGAGKSTLLKAILGLIAFEGEVRWQNNALKEIHRHELAKQVAYLPQSQTVHWPLSAERVVALGRIPHLTPWQQLGERDVAVIKAVMEKTDTWHLRGRPLNELAGGEKTLVLIARALAVEPQAVLADEPVAGLDPNHQMQVMELLRNLSRQDHGIVVVLHDLNLAARFCDRIVLLDAGAVQAAGSPKEVLTEDYLKKTYNIRVKSGEEEGHFYVIPWQRL